MSNNPFDPDYVEPIADTTAAFRNDFGIGAEKREPRATPPGFRQWDGGLISEPGAYLDLPISRYHGAEICVSDSASSTGLKALIGDKGARTKGKTPRHYWEQSARNPNRRAKEDTDALRLGRAFHDALLLPEAWATNYHRLPEGFSRAAKVKMAVEIAEADAAIAAGLDCMTVGEVVQIEAMVAALNADPLAAALFRAGEPEVTLAWQDKETGLWLRARPDWMMPNRAYGMNVKTDTDASYDGFSKAIGKFGYAQSAALELDGYEAVFGEMPDNYLHPVVEKPGAGWKSGDYIATALWELPAEDIERGRWLNRIAIRTLARCIETGKWDGYTPEPELCGMPGWARKLIDEGGAGEPHDDKVEGWMPEKEGN